MQIKKWGIILLLGLAVMVSSCTKKVNNCSLIKVQQGGATVLEYFFVNNKLAKVEQYNAGTGLLMFAYNITRDALGRVDYIDVLHADGTYLFRRKADYNSDGRVGQLYTFTDTNNDFIPETMNNFKSYVYNANGELIEELSYDASSVYQGSNYFTWTNGDIYRIDLGVGTPYALFTYDDKRYVYDQFSTEMFIMFVAPSYLSAHNITQVRYYDALGALTGSNALGYTYNADGYPLTESTNSMSYEYNCTEQ